MSVGLILLHPSTTHSSELPVITVYNPFCEIIECWTETDLSEVQEIVCGRYLFLTKSKNPEPFCLCVFLCKEDKEDMWTHPCSVLNTSNRKNFLSKIRIGYSTGITRKVVIEVSVVSLTRCLRSHDGAAPDFSPASSVTSSFINLFILDTKIRKQRSFGFGFDLKTPRS